MYLPQTETKDSSQLSGSEVLSGMFGDPKELRILGRKEVKEGVIVSV